MESTPLKMAHCGAGRCSSVVEHVLSTPGSWLPPPVPPLKRQHVNLITRPLRKRPLQPTARDSAGPAGGPSWSPQRSRSTVGSHSPVTKRGVSDACLRAAERRPRAAPAHQPRGCPPPAPAVALNGPPSSPGCSVSTESLPGVAPVRLPQRLAAPQVASGRHAPCSVVVPEIARALPCAQLSPLEAGVQRGRSAAHASGPSVRSRTSDCC